MNTPSKIITGWFVWTLGAIIFAHLCTNYIGDGRDVFVEAIYALFSLSYFIGIPVLTVLWILEDRR